MSRSEYLARLVRDSGENRAIRGEHPNTHTHTRISGNSTVRRTFIPCIQSVPPLLIILDNNMEDDGFNKVERPCNALTRQNKDEWFWLMKEYLIGEDLWQYLEQGSDATDMRHNGKIMSIINVCLGDDDQEDMADKTTAKELWDTLWKKYEEKLPSISRQYLQDLMGYKKPADTSIDDAWAKIREYGRKAAAFDSSVKFLCTPECCMQQLLTSLGPQYTNIRDAIDGNSIAMRIEQRLHKLREKEALINKENESAMRAKKKDTRQRRRRSSSSEDESPHRSSRRSSRTPRSPARQCYLCNGPHKFKNCPLKNEFHSFRKWMRMEKDTKSDSKSRSSSKKQPRAYNAEEHASLSGSTTSESDTEHFHAPSCPPYCSTENSIRALRTSLRKMRFPRGEAQAVSLPQGNLNTEK